MDDVSMLDALEDELTNEAIEDLDNVLNDLEEV